MTKIVSIRRVNKNKAIIFLTILTLLLTISYFTQTSKVYPSDKKDQKNTAINKIPRISGNEINITTPENKTYSSSMSGYYPGSFGFENDENGDIPFGLNENSEVNCDVQVIEELDGHKKVVSLYSSSSSQSSLELAHQFDNQSEGIVEYWWYKSSTYESGPAILDIWSEDDDVLISIRMDDDYNEMIEYHVPGYVDTGYPYYSDDQWIHMRIEFNCTSDTWSLWINQTKYLSDENFLNNRTATGINLIRFHSYDAANPVLYYVDAYGYSWDPNYNIGDNMDEGLLLSYNNNTNLDWIGYSLDRLTNRTILGNITFPIPADGPHTIQVFGNNSLGTMYQSNIRHFTTATAIKIITPENKTYTEPMSGYYPGSFGFENDIDNTFPSGWIEGGTTTGKTRIVGSKDGHNKVLLISDDDVNRITPRQEFSVEQSEGTVEFWVYFGASNNLQSTGIRLENSTGAVFVNIYADGTDNDEWVYTDGTTSIHTDLSAINEWFHVSIDFCCIGTYNGLSADKFQFIIRRADGSIYYDSPELNFLNFYDIDNTATLSITSWQNTIRDTWIDAVGYSWDPKYNIGDNLNEGLLLSFENSTNLDWMGYSLDGQPNRTILDNTTIPIPADGLHIIQVFGNDSLGTMYQSEKRYFFIDLNPPLSSISYIPLSGINEVSESTTFSLSADDGLGTGVSLIWYTINNSGWNVYTVPFNLSEHTFGFYNISYYAVDIAGHSELINFELVELIDISPPPDGGGGGGDGGNGGNGDDETLNLLPFIIIGLIAAILIPGSLISYHIKQKRYRSSPKVREREIAKADKMTEKLTLERESRPKIREREIAEADKIAKKTLDLGHEAKSKQKEEKVAEELEQHFVKKTEEIKAMESFDKVNQTFVGKERVDVSKRIIKGIGHETFICYSTKDEIIANAVCHFLEEHNIKCWMAPRDVGAGIYARSIINAITTCKLMVLIYTNHVNFSEHVRKELERAVAKGKPIIPLRTEEVIPSPEIEYYISEMHWLDAMTPPLEVHLTKLVRVVGDLLDSLHSTEG